MLTRVLFVWLTQNVNTQYQGQRYLFLAGFVTVNKWLSRGLLSSKISSSLCSAKLHKLLKLINHSSSLNKGNHDRDSVWISDLFVISVDFYDFISPFSPYFWFWLRRYIKHSRPCLTTFPNTSKVSKNTPLHIVFSALFLVLEMWSNTVFGVWYITSKLQKNL